MMDIESQIREIKSSVQRAEKIKARAEFQRDQAKATAMESAGRLKTEFGVSSIEEAKELRDKVQSRLNIRLSEIETAISSFL